MALQASVDTLPAFVVPDAPPAFVGRFPDAGLVSAAAGLLTPLRSGTTDRHTVRPRLVIAPGVVAVTELDPTRRDRTLDRARESAWKGAELMAADALLEDRLAASDDTLAAISALGDAVDWSEGVRQAEWSDHLAERIARRDAEEEPTRSGITSWSRKSRARMVRRLAELDYSPMFTGAGVPAMLTLTYPGDWLTVAPDAATCGGHLRSLAKRFQRAWGLPLVATWKREFQRRGAPHFHLMMVPPAGTVPAGRLRLDGEAPATRLNFSEWVSRAWAATVNHPDADQYAAHLRAGTGVDYAEGMRAADPKRLAVYFSKHGAYSAKEYQNHAPAEWHGQSVGRFWGYWGLEVATVTVDVSSAEAIAAARTLRRWQSANGYRVQVQRPRLRVDTATGEVKGQRLRRTGVWSGSKMRGRLGFVCVNDGPAFASALARYLDQVRDAAQAEEVARWESSPARLARLERLPEVLPVWDGQPVPESVARARVRRAGIAH